MKTAQFSLIAAALFCLTGVAQAANKIVISHDGFVGAGVSVDLEQRGTDSSTSAGLLNFEMKDGKSFGAYCVELGQFTSTNFTTYTVGSFSGSQDLNLRNLFSANYASVDTNTERAAFQLAVWELTHEQLNGPASVSELKDDKQYFNLDDSTSGYTALKNLANGYLNAGAAYQGSDLFQIEKLSNANHQDLLRFNAVTAVPEPSSYALLLAGLGVVGFLSKRRARSV